MAVLFAWPSAAEQMPFGKGVLWRVARAGVPPSHLFGTVHLTDPRVLVLPAPVRNVLEGARSITVEVVQSRETRAQMAQTMVFRDGRTLDAVLGDALFQATAGAARKYGLPPATLRALKPWAAMATLALPPAELARQARGVLPLDRMLVAEARRRGMEVRTLESVAEQLALFDALAMPHQIALLRQLVRDHHRIEEIHARTVEFYLARDVAGMLNWLLRQSAGDDTELMELFWARFIDRRNRTMAKRMRSSLERGNAFIAVGAAHLPGKAGILTLLARDRWRITRVY